MFITNIHPHEIYRERKKETHASLCVRPAEAPVEETEAPAGGVEKTEICGGEGYARARRRRRRQVISAMGKEEGETWPYH